MCIIGVKDFGVDPIDKDTLEHCFNNNGDGGGYAYLTENGVWAIKKGYMTWEAFWEDFSKDALAKENCYIVHFRFGTSGNTDGGNTHPFPIFETLDDMRKTYFETKYIAVHNGTCGSGKGIYSDTMVAIDSYISPLFDVLVDSQNKYQEQIQPILEGLINADGYGSRWVLTNGEDISLLGKGWNDDKSGVHWSNTMWKRTEVKPRNPNYKATTKTYTGAWRSQWGGYRYGNWAYDDEDWTTDSGASKKSRFMLEDPPINKGHIVNRFQKGVWWKWDPQYQYWELDDAENNKRKINIDEYMSPPKDHVASVDDRGKIFPISTIDVPDEYYEKVRIDNHGHIIWEKSQLNIMVAVQCPCCFGDSNLVESPFDKKHGELLCKDCGSVFNKDSGIIRMVHPEYKQDDNTKSEEN
jgi:uncharacterized protein YbaR (Trm112 family)